MTLDIYAHLTPGIYAHLALDIYAHLTLDIYAHLTPGIYAHKIIHEHTTYGEEIITTTYRFCSWSRCANVPFGIKLLTALSTISLKRMIIFHFSGCIQVSEVVCFLLLVLLITCFSNAKQSRTNVIGTTPVIGWLLYICVFLS